MVVLFWCCFVWHWCLEVVEVVVVCCGWVAWRLVALLYGKQSEPGATEHRSRGRTVLEDREAAHAAADEHAAARLVELLKRLVLALVEAGLRERLLAGDERVLEAVVVAARVLLVDEAVCGGGRGSVVFCSVSFCVWVRALPTACCCCCGSLPLLPCCPVLLQTPHRRKPPRSRSARKAAKKARRGEALRTPRRQSS